MNDILIRILLVEDNEDDYLILRDLLGDIALGHFDLEWADSYQSARELLLSNQYEICLLDYSLGQESGVELVREFAGRGTPFILLTGHEDYEVDVAAARAGAADYLVKNHINAPLLERSIRYAIERQNHVTALLQAQSMAQMSAKDLKLSETRFRRLFESAKDGILILDAQSGEIEDVNPYLCELLGYQSDELVGKPLWEVGPFREIAANQNALATFQQGETVRQDDLPFETRSGQIVPVECVSNAYLSGDKKVIQCNIRDIGERKKAATVEREWQRFLQSTLDALSSHVAVLDEMGSIVAVNRAWRDFSQANAGVGTNYLEVCASSENTSAGESRLMAQGIAEVIAGRQQTFCLKYPRHESGEEEWFNACVTRFEGEAPVRVVVAHENITQSERAAQQLRASEANLRRAQQIAKLGSWELDLLQTEDVDESSLCWSDEAFRIFGYRPGEIEATRANFLSAIHPDDREHVAMATEQSLREKKGQRVVHRILLPDGSERTVQERWELFVDEDSGQPLKMVGTVQDITQQKRAEESLRHSNELLRAITEGTSDAIYAKDLQSRYLMINTAGAGFLGRSVDEIVGRTDAELLSSDAAQAFNENDVRVVQSGIVQTHEETATVDGITRTYGATKGPLRGSNGDVVGIVGIARDITERKNAEEQLRFQKTLLEAQMETSLDGILVASSDGSILSYNRRFMEMWDVPPHVMSSGNDRIVFGSILEQVADAQKFEAMVARLREHPDEHSHDELLLRDGRILDRYTTPITNVDGQYYGRVLYFRDITERERASEAMARLAAIVESSSDAIVGKTLDGVITSWNAGAEMLYGYSPEEAIGHSALSLIAPTRPEEEAELLRRIGRGEQIANYETVRFCKDERRIDVSLTLSPIRSEAGEVTGASVIARDITERKKAEAALRESEARSSAVIQYALDCIITIDHQSRVVEFNPAAENTFGYTRAEALGRHLNDLIVPPKFRDAHEMGVAHYLQTGEGPFLNRRVEVPALRKDGTQITVELAATAIPHTDPPLFTAYLRDITESKQAEIALRESEERFASIVANVPGMVYQFVFQPDGSIEWPFVSEGCRDIYEMEPEEIRRNPTAPTECVLPDERDEFFALIADSAQTLAPWSWEGRHRLPSGKMKWIQSVGRPQRLLYGGTLWNGLILDITARKEAEEERDRFFTISLDMLVVFNMNGTFKRINPAYLETLGVDESELIGQPFLNWVHPEDHATTLAAVGELTDGNSVVGFENRYRRKDGTYRWLEWKAVPSLEEGVIYAAARDVTGRRDAQAALLRANDELELHVMERTAELGAANEALRVEIGERRAALDALREVAEAFRATQEMLQLVIDHIPHSVIWKDRNFRYLGCNNRVAWDAGYNSPEELLGKTDFDMSWAPLAHDYRADDAQVMNSNTAKLNIIEPIIQADGRHVWLRTNKVPLHDPKGAVVGVLVSYEDITLQREAEAAIHQAREEAEAANLAKSEFLSRMSHELRTPLNAILGFGQILEMRATDAKQSGNIQQILKAGRHLLGLINEVLDITRIEAGHLSLSLEPISIDIVVRETLDLVQPIAAERQIRLQNGIGKEYAGKHLLADQQRLKQVLLNLLSNAVKYNREGGDVVVSCEAVPASSTNASSTKRPLTHKDDVSNEGHLRILVRDTGNGLSADDISKIFMPFERLGAARTQIEGTGIGLTLCKRLVEAMNGQIGVLSEVGQGSTFWVELPLVASPLERVEMTGAEVVYLEAAAEDLGTVLYIEDNLSNITLVEQALLEQPYKVRFLTAMQGSVGLELAARHKPNLILLDVHLPDIMGDVVLRHLKSDASTRDIPVVVLSADATPSQFERLMAGGAKEYLTKPLDLKQFFRVLEETLRANE